MTTLPTPRRTLRRHRLARTSTWGAALLLALTACGADSPDPDASPSASSASVAPGSATAPASESGTSTASAAQGTTEGAASQSSDDGKYVPASEQGPAQNVPKPVMPEAVKEDTPEGAEAAVKHWWDAVYYLQQTNDPEPLKAVSTDECKICSSYVATINNIYNKGGWHTGTEPIIESILTQDLDYANSSTMLMTVEAGSAFGPDGTIPVEGELPHRSKQPWRAITRFDEAKSQWVVEEVTYEGAEE